MASGITYLHTVKPTIVHGDLKGVRLPPYLSHPAHHADAAQGNVLIDDAGVPTITDFGLSKVMEDLDLPLNGSTRGTSFFAGSTRWMAPEIIMALVEDDGAPPPITTASDVYAFASIGLEVSALRLFCIPTMLSYPINRSRRASCPTRTARTTPPLSSMSSAACGPRWKASVCSSWTLPAKPRSATSCADAGRRTRRRGPACPRSPFFSTS